MDPFSFNLHLENIGPHKNLDFTDNVKTLKTVIFAKNGEGKSFVSRAFQFINSKNAIENIEREKSDSIISFGKDKGELRLTIGNKQVDLFLEKENNPVPTNPHFIFHVFNSDYVRENIERRKYKPEEKRSGYILGKAAIDLSSEKEELSKKEKELNETEVRISEEINKNLKSFSEKYGLSRLSSFKNVKEKDFRIIEETNDSFDNQAFDDATKSFDTLKNMPNDLDDVPELQKIEIDFDTNELEDFLKLPVIHADIDTYTETFIKEHLSFIKEGHDIYEKASSVCPYCKQALSDSAKNIIQQYATFLQSKEKDAVDKCDTYLKKLKNIEEKIEAEKERFPSIKSAYASINNYFKLKSLDDFIDLKETKECLTKINEKIILKKNNVLETIFLDDSLGEFLKAIANLNEFIRNSNTYINNINESKKRSSSKLKGLKEDIVSLIDKKLFSSDSIKKYVQEKSDVKTLKITISEKESLRKIEKEKCILDSLKKNLRYFFREKYKINDDFSITFGENNITENVCRVLSDGEKTIIAFCYYLSEVYLKIENESDYKKLFFIIDDPISSLDDDYMYGVLQIIRGLKGTFPNIEHIRYIILTHNFYFLSSLCRNKIVDNIYMMQNSKIKICSKEDFQTPYFSHLSDIKKISEGIVPPSHTTANSLRQVVEGIKSIFYPKGKLEDFVNTLNSHSTLFSAFQDGSHGGFYFKEYSDKELIDLSKEVIKYIKESPIKEQLNCV